MSLSMTLGGSMPSTLPSLTVGTLEVTGAATFAATVTATGQFLAGDGSAGAPAYSFTNYPTYGMSLGAAGGGSAIIFTCGAVAQFAVGQNSGVGTQQVGPLGFTTAISSSPADLQVHRDAADVLAQRRGANAQTLRLYSTYTDAANYQRLAFKFDSNIWKILPESLGSGASRPVRVAGTNETGYVQIDNSGGTQLVYATRSIIIDSVNINVVGPLIWTTTNTYDIGAAAGANCPRTIYAATSVSAPDFTNGGTISFSPAGVSKWAIDAAGVFYCVADNVNDIGASGNYRPRNVYIANDVFIGNAIQAPAYRDSGANQVVGARQTGWSAMAGTATKGGFDTATVTLPELAQVVKAMLDGALTHGFFGA